LANFELVNSIHQYSGNQVQSLAPVPTSQHGSVTAFVPHSLSVAPFVFIRRDQHRNPLQAPYTGPYKVLESGPKAFRIEVGNREELISIDRLKPAYVDPISPVPLAQPPRRGRPPIIHHAFFSPIDILRGAM
jgi:cleavage and polyadenylation specificity factor subunit 1